MNNFIIRSRCDSFLQQISLFGTKDDCHIGDDSMTFQQISRFFPLLWCRYKKSICNWTFSDKLDRFENIIQKWNMSVFWNSCNLNGWSNQYQVNAGLRCFVSTVDHGLEESSTVQEIDGWIWHKPTEYLIVGLIANCCSKT